MTGPEGEAGDNGDNNQPHTSIIHPCTPTWADNAPGVTNSLRWKRRSTDRLLPILHLSLPLPPGRNSESQMWSDVATEHSAFSFSIAFWTSKVLVFFFVIYFQGNGMILLYIEKSNNKVTSMDDIPCNILCKYCHHNICSYWKIPTSRLRGCCLRLPSGPRGEESTGGALRVAEHCSCDFQRRLRRLQVRGQMGSYPIKLFYTSNIPIILQESCEYKKCLKTKRQGWNDVKAMQPVCTQTALVSNLYFFSQFLGILYCCHWFESIEDTNVLMFLEIAWTAGRLNVFLGCCTSGSRPLLWSKILMALHWFWMQIRSKLKNILTAVRRCIFFPDTTSENRLVAVWCGGIFGVQEFASFAHSASWPGQANMIVNMIGQWQEGRLKKTT